MKKSVLVSLLISLAVLSTGTTYVVLEARPPKRPPARGYDDPYPIVEEPEEPEPPVNYYPDTSGTIVRDGYTYKYRPHKVFGVETPSDMELLNQAFA